MICKLLYKCKKQSNICCHDCPDPCADKCLNDNKICREYVDEDTYVAEALNTTGIKGVSYNADKNYYSAYINIDKKLRTIGCFKSAEEAAKARLEAEKNRDNFNYWLAEFKKTRKRGRKAEI